MPRKKKPESKPVESAEPAVPLAAEKKPRRKSDPASSLEKMLKTKNAPTDIKEIANEFHSYVGGSKGYVKMVMEDYEACEAGSLARTRMHHLMKELFKLATPKDRLGDTSLITDDDLKKVWQEQMEKTDDPVLKTGQPDPPRNVRWIDHVCI